MKHEKETKKMGMRKMQFKRIKFENATKSEKPFSFIPILHLFFSNFNLQNSYFFCNKIHSILLWTFCEVAAKTKNENLKNLNQKKN